MNSGHPHPKLHVIHRVPYSAPMTVRLREHVVHGIYRLRHDGNRQKSDEVSGVSGRHDHCEKPPVSGHRSTGATQGFGRAT